MTANLCQLVISSTQFLGFLQDYSYYTVLLLTGIVGCAYSVLVGESKRTTLFQDLGADWKKIPKCLLQKQDGWGLDSSGSGKDWWGLDSSGSEIRRSVGSCEDGS